MNTIPAWESDGLLPPIRPSLRPVDLDRSPYKATLMEFVERFGVTSDRITLLKNFLEYRKALNNLGISKGFQWIDGSFVEDVETLQNRSPHDIDVVTFFKVPDGESQKSLLEKNSTIFTPHLVKQMYKLDAYPVILGDSLYGTTRSRIVYWYSMWSHTRTGVWKGFIELDLDTSNDADVLVRLDKLQEEMQNA